MVKRLNHKQKRLLEAVKLCCILVSFGLCHTQAFAPELGCSISSAKSVSQEQRVDEWPKYEVEGIPYQVALNLVTGQLGKPGSRQIMFIFLDENRFAEDSVLRIFRHIHFQVPQPTMVFVTVLTD